MRRVFLFGSIFLFLAIGLPSVTAESQQDIEKLIDETMADMDKFLSEASVREEPLAQEPLVEPALPKEPQTIKNLEFTQANLEDVLRVVSEAGGFNILLDPILKGKKIDLHLKDTTIDDALKLLYNAYGLDSYKIGNTLFISTQEKIKQGTIVTKVVELRNINVEEAKSLINTLVRVVNSSKEANTLVLIGAPEDINKAQEILTRVDVPARQVILESKVVEINATALKELGIDWSDSVTVTFQESKRDDSLSGTVIPEGSPLNIYKLARSAVKFDATLKILEERDKAKVLSSPRVTTMNNKEAEIFIGDRIPYTVTTVASGVATTEVRFVEPGIRLKITPSIIEKDFVVIKVEPEVSYIFGWRGTGDAYPWVKTREATAYVRVKNGQPFVLGGLLGKEDKKNLFKVPFLGSVPLLGNLFKYEKNSALDTELIITIIPTVIAERT